MGLRRGYLVALAVALLAAGVSILIPRSSSGLDAATRAQQVALERARRHLPDAMAALHRLRVPADFRRVTTGCRWYRCYVVPEGTEEVAPQLPGLLRSIGALNAETRRLQARLQAAGDTFARGMGMPATKMVGCDLLRNRAHRSSTVCAYPGVVADNFIAVFLGPYFACDPRQCRWTGESEVDITFPSGAAQA